MKCNASVKSLLMICNSTNNTTNSSNISKQTYLQCLRIGSFYLRTLVSSSQPIPKSFEGFQPRIHTICYFYGLCHKSRLLLWNKLFTRLLLALSSSFFQAILLSSHHSPEQKCFMIPYGPSKTTFLLLIDKHPV